MCRLQIEREARYHEYVAKQPFKNFDVLDERYRKRIVLRADPEAAARMPLVVNCEWYSTCRGDPRGGT